MLLFWRRHPDKVGLLGHILLGINRVAHILTRYLIWRISDILASLLVVLVFLLDAVLLRRGFKIVNQDKIALGRLHAVAIVEFLVDQVALRFRQLWPIAVKMIDLLPLLEINYGDVL